MYIYLAGCVSHYDTPENWNKATTWRRTAAKTLIDNGYEVFDPTLNWHINLDYTSNSMVIQNEYYLKKSDLLLVNLADLDKSYGTIFEIITAHHLGIPVIAFGAVDIMFHPHITHCLNSTFIDLTEALEFITNAYCQ